MKRIIIGFLLAVSVHAFDNYGIKGDFTNVSIHQHESDLCIKGIRFAHMVEQPQIPEQSYLSDFSSEDIILRLKDNSYYVVRIQDKLMRIACYDKSDLSGKLKILVDPGHGGKDMGAISKEGLKEKHVTLAYAKRLVAYLQNPVLNPVLTRHKDVFIDKYSRLEKVIREKPYLLFSVHADAYTSPHAQGAGIFYLDNSLGSRESQAMVSKVSDGSDWRSASRGFADTLLEALQGRYKLHAVQAKPLPLVVLRSPTHMSMLLELGFLSNPDEAILLANENYLDGFAKDVADQITKQVLERENIVYTGQA